MKYVVVHRYYSATDLYGTGREQAAVELQDEYGLSMFSIAEIIQRWNAYSQTQSAGWMAADKKSVEQVFSVKLKPAKD